jgi:cell division septum initiation protein DivIVA
MAQQMAEEAQKEAEELKLQSKRALEYSEREKQKRIEQAERADSENDSTN